MQYFKDGIRKIKETKQYAREKNVPNWITCLIGGILIAWFTSMVFSILSIDFIATANPNGFILNLFGYSLVAYPFILTVLFMMSIGKYPIKFMIYFTYLIQKGIMKLINKLDMIMWKRTGKDSLASNFMMKHRRLIQILIWIPLILSLVLRHLPK